MELWDARDKELDLKEKLAKIIASTISGIEPELVRPIEEDYLLADKLKRSINTRIIHSLKRKT